MKNENDAAALAKTMVGIGKSCGRNIIAVITNMDAPLGRNAVSYTHLDVYKRQVIT